MTQLLPILRQYAERGDRKMNVAALPLDIFELAIAALDVANKRGTADRWEYIWCHVLTPSELNKLGDESWELCYGYDSRNAYQQASQYCFFKRRK